MVLAVIVFEGLIFLVLIFAMQQLALQIAGRSMFSLEMQQFGQEMRDLLPSDLSTGMKRSVAIARALAARPECVLYDEPTTMVDPLMAQLLGDLIKRLKIQLNLTSIVVTHDMRLAAKLAERVVFLHEGRAIFFGTYAEMEKSPEPIIREFLELDELKLEA